MPTFIEIDRRLHEKAWNQGSLEVVDEICAPDIVIHDTGIPGGRAEGRDAYKMLIATYREAFPDFHVEELEYIAEGEHIAMRLHVTGTHLGALMGVPPTGKTVDLEGQAVIHYEGGLQSEVWLTMDELQFLGQLGLVENPLLAPA